MCFHRDHITEHLFELGDTENESTRISRTDFEVDVKDSPTVLNGPNWDPEYSGPQNS